jgi:hypothetical protein
MFGSSYLMLYYFEYRKKMRKLKRTKKPDIYDIYPIKDNSKEYENPIVQTKTSFVESDAETVVFNPKT